MKKLLQTLYILTPDSYLYMRNDNICVRIGDEEKYSMPAKDIESVVCFGKSTVSTPLIGYLGEKNIHMTFLEPNGTFLGRVCGAVSGNVLLRKKQYESLSDDAFVCRCIRMFLLAKIRNSKEVILRHARTEKDETDAAVFAEKAALLGSAAESLLSCTDADSMRGIEGSAATVYFSVFDRMLAKNAAGFRFETRSRRPPRNEVNAVLSFVYTLLAHQTESALEAVGLDPAAGYLHTLRPGRASFALDMMEELRAPLCDRFVITLFNRGQLSAADFEKYEEAVYLNDKGRRTVIQNWEKRKKEEIRHPFLDETIPIGMIPFAQAMLFARVLRGDLDEYPPFVWR